jgi:hypothetical protein
MFETIVNTETGLGKAVVLPDNHLPILHTFEVLIIGAAEKVSLYVEGGLKDRHILCHHSLDKLALSACKDIFHFRSRPTPIISVVCWELVGKDNPTIIVNHYWRYESLPNEL